MAEQGSFLAQLSGLNPLDPMTPVGKKTGLVFQSVLVIIATGLALGLILLLWTRYYLRRKNRRHHHHHERRVDPAPAPVLNSKAGGQEHHRHGNRRRKRRRRQDHRPRNPTLAETGGLPSPKTEPPSNPSL